MVVLPVKIFRKYFSLWYGILYTLLISSYSMQLKLNVAELKLKKKRITKLAVEINV